MMGQTWRICARKTSRQTDVTSGGAQTIRLGVLSAMLGTASLIYSVPAFAHDDVVYPTNVFWLSSNRPANSNGWYASAEEAFAAYSQYVADSDAASNYYRSKLDNLRPCQGPIFWGKLSTYCHDYEVRFGPPNYAGIYGQGTTSVVSFVPYCPNDYVGLETLPEGQRGSGTDADPWRSNAVCVKRAQVNPMQCSSKSAEAVGNPIVLTDGTKRQRVMDYRGATAGLSIERNYISSANGWLSDQSWSMVLPVTQRPANSVIDDNCLFLPVTIDGQTVNKCFNKATKGANYADYRGPDGVPRALEKTQDGSFVVPFEGDKLFRSTGSPPDPWILKSENKHAFVVFDDSGRVSREVQPSGASVSYTYAASKGLTAIKADHFGRSVQLNHDAAGLLSSVVDPAGQVIRYTHHPTSTVGAVWVPMQPGIASVTYQDGAVEHYHENESEWITNPVADRRLLTGITDANGNRFSTYKYDGSTPVSTEHAGGVNRFTVTYWGGTRYDIQEPLDSIRTVYLQSVNGINRIAYQSQPAGSGCSASSQSLSYDERGNITSRTEFNGEYTTYSYDAQRNLETQRVEGSGQANARTVSTQWHPDWRLQSRVAQPGKITTYVYNGQKDPTAGNAVTTCAPASAKLPDGKPIAVLCKKVERATTDANGAAGFAAALQSGVAARVWQWTYNQYGQVLTEDGPRTDVSDITTYTYHSATAFSGTGASAVGVTVGDLATVTNPAGQVSRYTQYNKHGQLLESIDPNGVVSSFTYDLRQRMLSSTVGGQTTSYTYDPAGLLKRITHPDGSWIGYEHDAAHRQIATYDNLGNRVDYTLDNAGNRIAEQLKDPTGALRKQVARSLDALGRVQQTSGRE